MASTLKLLNISVTSAACLTLSFGIAKPAEASFTPEASQNAIAQVSAPSPENSFTGTTSSYSLTASWNTSATTSTTPISLNSSQLVQQSVSGTDSGITGDLLASVDSSTETSQPVPEPLTVIGTLLGAAGVWRMKQKLANSAQAEAKQ